MKKRSKMHVEQAKEVDALGDSNVKSGLVNMMHATYEKEKDDNPWPMIEATSKLLNT